MKIHEKKKAYRREMAKAAKAGLINNAEGKLVKRGEIPDTSMRRDYSPQE